MFRFDFLGLDIGNGVNAPELAFGIPENGTETVGLVGNLTAVPVPAAVWLFGSALVGLVTIGRKKS